jgi:hypothetical protein
VSKVTSSNYQQQGSGTLIHAYGVMARFESNDVNEEIRVLGLQTAIGETLESRGFTYCEDENDWEYVLGGSQ